MKYLLYSLTILPIQLIGYLWDFKWRSYNNIKQRFNKPVGMYAMGAFHFGAIVLIIMLLILDYKTK